MTNDPSARPDLPDGARRVLVVGAGLAGSTCALTLARAGATVTVVDKGRGPGGRCSTRRVGEPADGDALRFDHGAQYFTCRDRRFRDFVDRWLERDAAELWRARVVVLEAGTARPEGRSGGSSPPARYVGVPGMSSLVGSLQDDLDVSFGSRAIELRRDRRGWTVVVEQDGGRRSLGPFDALVLGTPAPQAVDLLHSAPDPAPADILRHLEAVRMAPCWATLAVSDGHWCLGGGGRAPFDGAFVDGSPLSWMARQDGRPGRSRREAWVLHATPDWSRRHLEDDPDAITAALLEAAGAALGLAAAPPVVSAHSHRWRYASVDRPLGEDALWTPGDGLGLCGDWCPGGRVEGAVLSGLVLAERMLDDGAARGPAAP